MWLGQVPGRWPFLSCIRKSVDSHKKNSCSLRQSNLHSLTFHKVTQRVHYVSALQDKLPREYIMLVLYKTLTSDFSASCQPACVMLLNELRWGRVSAVYSTFLPFEGNVLHILQGFENPAVSNLISSLKCVGLRLPAPLPPALLKPYKGF